MPSTTKSSVTPDKKMFENKHYVLVSDIDFFSDVPISLGAGTSITKKLGVEMMARRIFTPTFTPNITYHMFVIEYKQFFNLFSGDRRDLEQFLLLHRGDSLKFPLKSA